MERKWIHNLLSRASVAGAEPAGHGVVRRLSIGAIRQIALARRLALELGFTVERAASLAADLIAANGEIRAPSGLSLRVDLDAFDREVDARLAEGVEAVVLARRGRPALKDPG